VMGAMYERCLAASKDPEVLAERFSEARRTQVIRRAMASQEPRHGVVPLFLPLRRWAAIAAAPAALALGIVGLATRDGWISSTSPQRPGIEVAKVGDRVVFSVRNGQYDHRLMKATDPRSLADVEAVRMLGGVYEESLGESAPARGELVFYRIE